MVWLFWLRVGLLNLFLFMGALPRSELSSSMERHWYYIGIAFFGMVNGLFNQIWLLFALIHVQILAPALLFGSVALTLLFSSLMVSTATIILGGIPAAIYERFAGAKDDSSVVVAVDLARRHRNPDDPGDRQFLQNRPLSIAFAAVARPATRSCYRHNPVLRCTLLPGAIPAAGLPASVRAMDHIRVLAYETVMRACGFGSLAIFCVMVGMSFDASARLPGRRLPDDADGADPDLQGLGGAAPKTTAAPSCGSTCPRKQRPPEGYAQWAVATVMRETYLTFARWTSLIAIVMWVLALLVLAVRPLAPRSARAKKSIAAIWTSLPDRSRISPLAGNLRTGRDRRPFA